MLKKNNYTLSTKCLFVMSVSYESKLEMWVVEEDNGTTNHTGQTNSNSLLAE